MAFEQRARFLAVAGQGQLEALRGLPRQVDEFQELVMFAPRVALAAKPDLAPLLLPVADARERCAGDGRRRIPKIHDHRLPRGVEGEKLTDRQSAVRAPDVFPEGKKRDVRIEEINRRLELIVQLDLQLHRVGFQIHEPPGGRVLGQRDGAAVEVDDDVGLGVEPRESGVAEPEAAPVTVQCLKGPAVAEPKAAHHAGDESRGLLGAVLALVRDKHGRRARVRLHVPDLAAEPFEAHEIMHVLPDHAADRHLRHHAEHDDFGTRRQVHAGEEGGSRVRRRACAVCKSESCL